ncbi:uncharacterized protein LOC125447451 [Stegostoma tigrinum]|uniref:uncharacterized protein LOC125447451 n=1 Tax=Stegostoma tigrinum TaxID=3053191 RepID=UPI00202ACCC3|nr:uncharacterized protein LOC125447451 [Stegostoma tigrinum]XP_048377761.1 uncharacterized protein LOC125447451 [Stegostoma tigrinum]
MTEVKGDQEMTKEGLEEHPVETSTSACENQDVPKKEETENLTINEGSFETSKATEETLTTEVQQAEADSAEITVEEQVTERNEDVGGKVESGLKTRHENTEFEETISVETATEHEETSLMPDIELTTEQSDQDPSREELPIDNRSIEDGQIHLHESEGQGCREEAEAIMAMENIALSTFVDESMGENVQECEDSQAQCAVDEERFKTGGKAEESPNGLQGATDFLVQAGPERDWQEGSDSTNKTLVGVNNSDKTEECCINAKYIAGQTKLFVYSDIGNGSMMASLGNGKSSEGAMLLTETQGGVAEACVCYDEELPTEVKTGQKTPANTHETVLKISENTDADLEIQTKSIEKLRQTSAKGSEEIQDTYPLHAPICSGYLSEYLENSAENQGTDFDPSAERTSEIPVSTSDNPTEKLAVAEEQATSNDSAPSPATEIMEKTEEHEPKGDNLTESVQAMELLSKTPGENAGVSNIGLEQQCKTGISKSENQGTPELTEPGDNQMTVAGEQ